LFERLARDRCLFLLRANKQTKQNKTD